MRQANSSETSNRTAPPPLALGILLSLCAAKLLLHIFTSVQHYGYFRDELYYLDMARHLDWGYVDAAPLIAVYAKIALWMGGSLAALRILPALAGAALIALTILIARELGGERYAQFLAGLATMAKPGPSTSSVRSTVCRKPTRATRTIGIGDRLRRFTRTSSSSSGAWTTCAITACRFSPLSTTSALAWARKTSPSISAAVLSLTSRRSGGIRTTGIKR